MAGDSASQNDGVEPPTKRQRTNQPGGRGKAKKAAKVKPADEELGKFVASLLGELDAATTAPFEPFSEHEVEIEQMSSHAFNEARDWIIAVPFCLPGERVLARIYRSDLASRTSHGDLVKVIRASAERDDSRVRCQYFARCGGCQMLDYGRQLELKQQVVERAYKLFAGLQPSQVPEVQPTLASPAQYGYRTKLTPHFNQPKDRELAIGFETKGRRTILDIEDCPIATDVVNAGLTRERERVQRTIKTFKRGATLLLRHALPADGSSDVAYCETDHKRVIRERVGGRSFDFTAGEFFQVNTGILEVLVDYVRTQLPPRPAPDDPARRPRFLVDAYCGSGLFGISLADSFDMVAGVEISADSVRYAKHNAELNNVDNATWLAGEAERIFKSIEFPADQTTVLIDPPRKGCDDLFLQQLIAFGPAQVLYVSCNVHTQARDVGVLVRDGDYVLRSLLGADLFPQTHHVEGVAVLSRS